MSERDESKTGDELGDLEPRPEGELTEEEAGKVAGGLWPKGTKKSPTTTKPPTYVPAPPAPAIPVPYPSGM